MEKSNFQQAVVDISKVQSAAVMEIIPITQLYRLLQHRSMLARDALSERDEQLFKMKMEAIRHLNVEYMISVAIDCRTFRIPTNLQDCTVVKIDTLTPLNYIHC